MSESDEHAEPLAAIVPFEPRIAQAVGCDFDGTLVIGPKIYDLPHRMVWLIDGRYRDFVTNGPLSIQQRDELFAVYGIRVTRTDEP